MSGTLGPNVAGTWYPAERESLDEQVTAMLASPAEPSSAADDDAVEPVAALIAPHAGFVYSGRVAASGFVKVRDRGFDRVILLGPSHYHAFPGAAVPTAESYRTPLGQVPLDSAAAAGLGGPSWRADDAPFRQEHSLEAEIPFLQQTLRPGWRLLPVLLGAGNTPEHLAATAEALEPLFDERTLIVVSSDFTHYGFRFNFTPFYTDVPQRIERLDLGAVEAIVAGDAEAFERYVDETAATICGRAAIGVLLRMLPRKAPATLVSYDTSGRQTDDWTHSVSYAAIAFGRPAANGEASAS